MQLARLGWQFWLLLAGCLFITVAIFFVFFSGHSAKENEPTYPITRVFSYSFNVKNPGKTPIKNARLLVFSPLKQTANQRLGRVDASLEFSANDSGFPLQLLEFEFDTLAPFETRIVKLKVEVALSEESNFLPEVRGTDYLGEERLIETLDPAIIKQAVKLAHESRYETVKAIYDFVSEYFEDTGFVKDDLGASYALKNKRGDCTEYATLVAALARANDIPARVISGFVYPASTVLKPSDYHAWTEVFIDGRWQIVDALKKNFMVNQSHYLGLRFLTNNDIVPGVSSMLLAFSEQEVIVSMN